MSELCKKINFAVAGSEAYVADAEFYIQTTIVDTAFTNNKLLSLPIAPIVDLLLPNTVTGIGNPYKNDATLPYYLLKGMCESYDSNRTNYLIALGAGNPYAYVMDCGVITLAYIVAAVASGDLDIPNPTEITKLLSLLSGIDAYFTAFWLLS